MFRPVLASPRPASGPCRLATVLLLAHLLAVLALAACPEWHHWLHADADDDEHQCAVTLFRSGGADAPTPPAAAAPAPWGHAPAAVPPAWPVVRVAPVFSSARIFEHGPPSPR